MVTIQAEYYDYKIVKRKNQRNSYLKPVLHLAVEIQEVADMWVTLFFTYTVAFTFRTLGQLT